MGLILREKEYQRGHYSKYLTLERPTGESAKRKSLKGAEDDEGHVVALRGACGEGVGGLHDAGYGVTSRDAVAGGNGFYQPRFAPFGEIGFHGFAEAVCIDDQQVARGQRDFRLLVC